MLKTTTKLLAAALALSLCACASNGGSQSASSDTQPTEETAESPAEDSKQDTAAAQETTADEAEEDDGIVEFDDVTIVDDDRITVKLTQFYEKEVNWLGSTEPVMEKYFTFKVKNKTDGDILFNVNEGYINDEGVTLIMQDGNSGPAAGKSKNYSYDVQLDTSPEGTPLESLDDLYGLEATIQTYLKDSNGYLVDERKVQFNFSDILRDGAASGDTQETTASEEDIKAALQGTWQMGSDGTCTFDNDTITLDSEKLTLSGTYDLNLDKSAIIGHYEATDGTVDYVILYDYDGKTIRLFRDIEKTDELIKQ